MQAQELGDLLIHGEAPELGLREEQLAIAADLEHAAGATDELDLEGRVIGPEFGGQTGRLRQVVSLSAVLDSQVHLRSVMGVLRPEDAA